MTILDKHIPYSHRYGKLHMEGKHVCKVSDKKFSWHQESSMVGNVEGTLYHTFEIVQFTCKLI